MKGDSSSASNRTAALAGFFRALMGPCVRGCAFYFQILGGGAGVCESVSNRKGKQGPGLGVLRKLQHRACTRTQPNRAGPRSRLNPN